MRRERVAELFGAAAVGVPGAVDGVAVAQEHVDAETGAGRGVDVGAERALRRRVPLHLVADLVAVGQRLLDRSVGDDDEPRVVVVQELQPGELRRESGAAAALPLGAVLPHVVVDDELRTSLEHVDQSDGPVLADQRVVSHLDHREPTALRGDGVQLAGRRLLPAPQLVKRGAPGLLIDDRWLRGRDAVDVCSVMWVSFRCSTYIDTTGARNSSRCGKYLNGGRTAREQGCHRCGPRRHRQRSGAAVRRRGRAAGGRRPRRRVGVARRR